MITTHANGFYHVDDVAGLWGSRRLHDKCRTFWLATSGEKETVIKGVMDDFGTIVETWRGEE